MEYLDTGKERGDEVTHRGRALPKLLAIQRQQLLPQLTYEPFAHFQVKNAYIYNSKCSNFDTMHD